MIVDADQNAALTELKKDLALSVIQKFGTDELFDLDEMLSNMLIYYDFHELLQKPGIRLVLENVMTLNADADTIAENLSALNVQVESMRCIHIIAAAEKPDATFAALIEYAFLNEEETGQIIELIQWYAQALQEVDDSDEVDYIDLDADAMVRCLNAGVMAAYLTAIDESKKWLQPVKILFALDKFEGGDFGENVDTLQSIFRGGYLRSEDEYRNLIERFEEIKQPFLADAARLLLFFVAFIQHLATVYEYIETEKDAIQQVLDRVSGYDPNEWTIFEEMQALFKVIIGNLHMMLGIIYALPVKERVKHLEQAEQAYLNSGVLIMRIAAPSLCWMRAQLVAEQAEREALEASAYKLVYDLLSGTVLEEKPLDRVIGMTTLMLLPARWKIEKGNFEGALENIAISRSLSFALSKVIQDEMGGTIEELDKEISDPDTPPEKQQQLKGLRDFYLPLIRTGDYWTFTCDLLTYTINAKLAESQSKFQEAYRLYDEAARLEEDMRKIILVWMSLYANITTLDGIVGLDAPQHSIRSTYFQGMASLSRGDSELMKGDYAEARKHYQNANTTFDTAARSWTLQMERLNSPSQIDGRANADRERRLCLDRMRYCDAKDEMAQAQRYSAYDEFADASEHFDNAAIILNALWKDSLDRETPRNLALFKASEMFCKGCALLEEARRVSREDIMLKAKEPIDRAVSLFEDASEPLWSKYINALRLEYEADIYKKLSNASASQKNQLQAAVYAQFAQKQASEASDIFKQLGVEKRVSGMDRLAHSMAHAVVESQALSIFSPPNPADAPMASSNNVVQSMKDQLLFGGGVQPGQMISENRLDTFLAEMSAIDSNLDDLKQQFDNGDLDQARYLKMEAKRIQQRSAILQKVRKELEGRDKDLDTIMQDATTGGQEERVLMDRLAEVAQRRGLTSSLIDSLTRHQGTFLPSLIEVGKQLIKLSD